METKIYIFVSFRREQYLHGDAQTILRTEMEPNVVSRDDDGDDDNDDYEYRQLQL